MELAPEHRGTADAPLKPRSRRDCLTLQGRTGAGHADRISASSNFFLQQGAQTCQVTPTTDRPALVVPDVRSTCRIIFLQGANDCEPGWCWARGEGPSAFPMACVLHSWAGGALSETPNCHAVCTEEEDSGV
jgi:hypothetical protein